MKPTTKLPPLPVGTWIKFLISLPAWCLSLPLKQTGEDIRDNLAAWVLTDKVYYSESFQAWMKQRQDDK